MWMRNKHLNTLTSFKSNQAPLMFLNTLHFVYNISNTKG